MYMVSGAEKGGSGPVEFGFGFVTDSLKEFFKFPRLIS